MTHETEIKKTPRKSRGRNKNINEKNIEDTVISENSEEILEKINDSVDISPYVSNVEGDVYAIAGLPEEFIATLFAWVSRSPKSFKEHLKKAIKEFGIQAPTGQGFTELSGKAKAFHEKWTVGYGHSSVAEHAVAHVGIEKVSRLASAELELSNGFLSITEYSQRYQKPKRGDWHNPFEKMINHSGSTRDMKPNPFYEKYEQFMHMSYSAFNDLTEAIHMHLLDKEGIKYGTSLNGDLSYGSQVYVSEIINEKDKKRASELRKLAFEDARYVLPLSMYTQLGMTANGRAWRDGIATLANSNHKESVKLADDLRTEITKILPVLLKYAEPSQYQTNSKKRVATLMNGVKGTPNRFGDVQLLSVNAESTEINKVIALLTQEAANKPYKTGVLHSDLYISEEERVRIIKDLLHEMAHFDMAPEVFKHIQYSATFLISEANWHQLLRHNRMTDFTYGKPTTQFGVTMPPRIVEAGLQKHLKDIARLSEELYNELVENGYSNEAEYVVLNAHKRQVYASFNLWEAYHLINLRTSDEAQWDIRETFNELHRQIELIHPLLTSMAKRR